MENELKAIKAQVVVINYIDFQKFIIAANYLVNPNKMKRFDIYNS